MKKLAVAVVFVWCALGLGNMAHAAPVKWTLPALTFMDGATGSGSFVYDGDTGQVSNVNITTTTTSDFTGRTYTFACNSECVFEPERGLFFFLTHAPGTVGAGSSALMVATSSDPFPNGPGTAPVFIVVEFVCQGNQCTEFDVSGEQRVAEVPDSAEQPIGPMIGVAVPAAPPAVRAVTAVPTLSQWMLVLLALIVGSIGIRRRFH